MADGPKLSDYVSEDSKKIYTNVIQLLDKSKIKYTEKGYLVRGLDYYKSL